MPSLVAPTLAPTSSSALRGRRSDIQGLRAVAVGAVVLFHARVPFLDGGYVGVDVFFVISGFLITTHLLGDLEARGRIGFAEFYARRARRLLPASFTVIVATVVAALIWVPPLQLRQVYEGAVASALYVPNVLFAAQGVDYLSEATPSLFQHYWSLGVEEQFYLVWPIVLVAIFRLAKRRRTRTAAVLALVVVSFGAGLVLSVVRQPVAFFMFPTRAWELGVGALVAFALAGGRTLLTGRRAAIAAWVGLALVVASVVGFDASTLFPGYAAAVPVLGTALVIAAHASGERWGPGRFLALPGVQLVGAISYSLYLVHWPLLVIPQAAVGYANPLPLWLTAALAALAVPLAWLLWRCVETPGQRVRWLVAAGPARTLVVTLGCSLLLAACVPATSMLTSRVHLDDGRSAPATTIGANPHGTDYVPTNLRPSLRTVDDDVPSLYGSGCHLDFTSEDPSGCSFGPVGAPTIVLFGDSHAAQWFPALEALGARHGYRIETHTKSSCPSVSVSTQRGGSSYTSCLAWRETVIDRLVAERPALVVVSNFGAPDDAHSTLNDGWEPGTEQTIDRLRQGSAVVVLADTPNLGQTPSICLSAHLDDATTCGRPRTEALASSARRDEVTATQRSHVPLVDLTDDLCDTQTCDPVLGNTLIYRDAHHLTATFSALMAEPLWQELRGHLGRSDQE